MKPLLIAPIEALASRVSALEACCSALETTVRDLMRSQAMKSDAQAITRQKAHLTLKQWTLLRQQSSSASASDCASRAVID
jgi:hypothetical protein